MNSSLTYLPKCVLAYLFQFVSPQDLLSLSVTSQEIEDVVLLVSTYLIREVLVEKCQFNPPSNWRIFSKSNHTLFYLTKAKLYLLENPRVNQNDNEGIPAAPATQYQGDWLMTSLHQNQTYQNMVQHPGSRHGRVRAGQIVTSVDAIYAVGGDSYETASNFECYSIYTNSWAPLQRIPIKLLYSSVSYDASRKTIYLIGGINFDTMLLNSAIFEYSIQDMEWREMANPASSYSLAATPLRPFFVISDDQGHENMLPYPSRLSDELSEGHETFPYFRFTASRFGHASIIYHNYLIIVGGKSTTGYLANIDVVNLETNRLDRHLSRRFQLSSLRIWAKLIIFKGHLYVIGGDIDALSNDRVPTIEKISIRDLLTPKSQLAFFAIEQASDDEQSYMDAIVPLECGCGMLVDSSVALEMEPQICLNDLRDESRTHFSSSLEIDVCVLDDANQEYSPSVSSSSVSAYSTCSSSDCRSPQNQLSIMPATPFTPGIKYGEIIDRFPEMRRNFHLIQVSPGVGSEDLVYIYGGKDIYFGAMKSIYQYSLVTNQWRQVDSISIREEKSKCEEYDRIELTDDLLHRIMNGRLVSLSGHGIKYNL